MAEDIQRGREFSIHVDRLNQSQKVASWRLQFLVCVLQIQRSRRPTNAQRSQNDIAKCSDICSVVGRFVLVACLVLVDPRFAAAGKLPVRDPCADHEILCNRARRDARCGALRYRPVLLHSRCAMRRLKLKMCRRVSQTYHP